MSIRLKLLLMGGTSLLVMFLLTGFLFLSAKTFNSSLEKNKTTQRIATYAFERRLILDEYLLYKLERSRQQWSIISNKLTAYIDSRISIFSQPKEKELISSLQKNIDDNGKIFFQLISFDDRDSGMEEFQKAQRARITSQLLVKSQDIISAIDQLSIITQNEAVLAQENIIFFLISLIGSFILIMIIVITFLWESIVVPIAKLQQGTKIIAGGNLLYKVDVHGHNELGQLAILFNEMTSKLSLAMEKTKEEFQKFRLAFDNVSDHIIITNPQGIVIYANKGAENTTGYTQKEMIGQRPSLWGNLMSKEFYDEMWKTIKVDKKEFTGEIKNKRKNGEIYQAQTKIAPVFDSAGKIKFFVGIERDITKEKEIDQAKTEFVLLASHQLRTPLSMINWYSQMLLAGNAGPMNVKQTEYVGKVSFSGLNMVKLVNTLLDISHLELGMFVADPALVDFVKLAKDAIEEQKLELKKKKIKLIQKFTKKLPKVLTDPKLIHIVVQNLLSNAIKYTPAGGTVDFQISFTSSKKIFIKISDTGYGIPHKQQDKIFSKLFRADNARIKDTTGAGLGLYMVKSIIERTGGKIWFESEENKGTTFFIEMPLRIKLKKSEKIHKEN